MNHNQDPPSPPWSLRLLADLDAADARATVLARALTPEQLNWKPGPAQWSVGQCLEHLAITNEVYCRAIAEALANHPHRVVQEIEIGWFGRLFIREVVDPVVRTKRRAPRKIAPPSLVEPAVLDRFLRSNQTPRDLIRRAQHHDVNRIRFRNPFVPLVRFSVGTGLEILPRHERRHLQQAERVRESPGFPASAQSPAAGR